MRPGKARNPQEEVIHEIRAAGCSGCQSSRRNGPEPAAAFSQPAILLEYGNGAFSVVRTCTTAGLFLFDNLRRKDPPPTSVPFDGAMRQMKRRHQKTLEATFAHSSANLVPKPPSAKAVA